MNPSQVNRDALGWWEHPELESFDADSSRTPTHSANIRKFADSGMELVRVAMPASLIHEQNHMQHWEPRHPAGEGWFLILVWWPDAAGSENGPAAWFARHGLQQSLFSEAA